MSARRIVNAYVDLLNDRASEIPAGKRGLIEARLVEFLDFLCEVPFARELTFEPGQVYTGEAIRAVLAAKAKVGDLDFLASFNTGGYAKVMLTRKASTTAPPFFLKVSVTLKNNFANHSRLNHIRAEIKKAI